MRNLILAVTLCCSLSFQPSYAQTEIYSGLDLLRCDVQYWVEQVPWLQAWLNLTAKNSVVFVDKDNRLVSPPQPIVWKLASGCLKTKQTNQKP